MPKHFPRRVLAVVLVGLVAAPVVAAGLPPVAVELQGDWRVRVVAEIEDGGGRRTVAGVVDVPGPTIVTVRAERYDALQLYRPAAPGWARATALRGVAAQECTTLFLLDKQGLQVRGGPEPNAESFVRGRDYEVDLDWGRVGRLEGGRIGEQQPVFLDYRHALLRLDSIVLDAAGRIALRPGTPRSAAPLPPPLAAGERRLANVWLPGFLERLSRDELFDIRETAYPEPPPASPTPAERFLPRTLKKLRDGEPLRILAWGDSVTVGSYVPGYPQRALAGAVRRPAAPALPQGPDRTGDRGLGRAQHGQLPRRAARQRTQLPREGAGPPPGPHRLGVRQRRRAIARPGRAAVREAAGGLPAASARSGSS